MVKSGFSGKEPENGNPGPDTRQVRRLIINRTKKWRRIKTVTTAMAGRHYQFCFFFLSLSLSCSFAPAPLPLLL